MKPRPFIITVILTNIFFILLQVDKHNRVTQYMYHKQQLEQQVQQRTKQYDQAKQELCSLKQPKTVKAYAQKYLKMSPVTLKQIKKLRNHA